MPHTLKGAARIVKQVEVANLAHAMEDALVIYRDQTGPIPKEEISRWLRMTDQCMEKLSAILTPAQQTSEEISRAATKSESNIAPIVERDEAFHSVRVDIAEMDAFLYDVAETGIHLSTQWSESTALLQLSRNAEVLTALLRDPEVESILNTRIQPANNLRRIAEEIRDGLQIHRRRLQAGFERSERDFDNLWQRASNLRLMPAKLIFQSLERSVRDSADSLNKEVLFESEGGETRLDAHVLLALRDALIHVMRNAVAHGIESKEERKSAGKNSKGKVSLHVHKKGQLVAFVVRDDGRGLDFSAIKAKGLNSGAISTAQQDSIQQAELIQLLLRGGISTAADVSQVSGRGIGMEAVRSIVVRLKGSLDLRSESGHGTTVEIVVPISMESVEAISAVVGDLSYMIPFASMQRTLRIHESDLIQLPEGLGLNVDGGVIPFRSLEEILEHRPSVRPSSRAWTAIVLQVADSRAAIGVDRLEGVQSVVIRPLPELCGKLPTIIGTAIDSEGNPRLLLDPAALIPQASAAARNIARKQKEQLPILIVDDSLTTRMLEQSVLEAAGYRVETAISGEDGLQKAKEKRYALFLVDVEMPGMDGFELLERFQRDPVLHRIPAVLVTSRNSPDDRRRGQQVGARDHIIKSEFDQRYLLAKIAQLIGEGE